MGITSDILAKAVNRHVTMRGDQTLGEALLAWQEKQGQEWWFLIVEVAPYVYLAARFSEFKAVITAQGQEVLHRQLGQLGEPLLSIGYVDQSSSLESAELAAESSPALVVVVTSGESIVGILAIGGTRSAGTLGEPGLMDVAGLVVAGGEKPPAKEMAPPAPAAPPASSPPQPGPTPSTEGQVLNVEIGRDVAEGGQVNVAGRDVNIYQVAHDPQTKEQGRRFEAAFPQEAHVGTAERLEVAVMLPDAPSPFGDKDKPQAVAKGDEVKIALPVDSKTGELKPVEIEVSVTAPGFRIQGESKKHLTVHPDGRTQTRWFLLEPVDSGKRDILLELSQDGRLLQEIAVKTEIFSPEQKARSALNLSLKIATFSLQFNFATG